MKNRAGKTQKNKSQAVANSLPKLQSADKSVFRFEDNKSGAAAQMKLQEMADSSPQVKQLKAFQELANNSPKTKQTAQLQAMANTHSEQPVQMKKAAIQKVKSSASTQHSPVVQRVPLTVTVTGLTHLVQAINGSIFEGREVGEVSQGMAIEIENSDKLRSRRGPNQESNRADDLGGAAVYRWVRVTKVNNRAVGANIYIRDDTFTSQHPNPLGNRPSIISPGQRGRSGALAHQEVHLVGTKHINEPQYDKSNRISDHDLAGADLIVEHPTPLGRRRTDIDRTVLDPTQNSLLGRAAGSNARIIGGDGRKLSDAQGRIHALSIRSQPQELDLAAHVDTAHIITLATQFINTSLGLGNGDIGTIIQNINLLGTYRRTGAGQAPNVISVLANGFRRVHTITKYFKPQVKIALRNKVLAVFRTNITAATEEIQGELDGLHGHYFGKTLSVSDQNIYSNGVRDLNKQLTAVAVSPFHDAISNLTLFAETLASNRQNLVVAFGREHTGPLHELLTEVDGVHKNYNIHNRT